MPLVSQEELEDALNSSYPGTNNIREENKLRCFNKNMIILKALQNHTLLDMYLQTENLHYALYQIVERCDVFYLMSILPQVEATLCKNLLDKTDFTTWCPNLFNILFVLANWGVSLNILGVEKQAKKFYTENLPKDNLEPPNSNNVEMVLQVISSKMALNAMNDKEKIHLIVCLTKVSLEIQMKPNQEWFCKTIKVLVDGISDWSENKAKFILKKLKVTTINILNAHHICQIVFHHKNSARCMVVRRLATQELIDRLFNEASFTAQTPEELFDNMPPPDQLLERLDVVQLQVLILLLRSHLDIQTHSDPPVSNRTLKNFLAYERQLREYVLVDNNLKQLNRVLAQLGGSILAERRRLYNVGLLDQEGYDENSDDN